MQARAASRRYPGNAMPLAGLILLASLAPVAGASAHAGKTVAPVAPLAAADVAFAASAASRLPSTAMTSPASLLLASPLVGRDSRSSRVLSWKSASGSATRAVLGRLGASLESAARAGRGASAEPIAAALDGSESLPAGPKDETPTDAGAIGSRPSDLAPSRGEASVTAADEPPLPSTVEGPRPWKAKAKKGATIGAGWLLLALGAALWILPFPGPTGLILGGLALLSKHYAWAAVAQARVLALTLAMTAWVLAQLRLRKS